MDRREYVGAVQNQVDAAYQYVLEKINMGMRIKEIYRQVSIEKMMEGYSKLRNPVVANAFAYMTIIEKWGTGIPRLLRECREYGLPEPKVMDFDGDFRVNMYRGNKEVRTQESLETTQDYCRQFTEEDMAVLIVVTLILSSNHLEVPASSLKFVYS